ncbi:MAG: hypothetical protein JNK93_10835, partial [Planctomycetia bacterium]|nr:hypothetical protein [Planctomycetia bacterium]
QELLALQLTERISVAKSLDESIEAELPEPPSDLGKEEDLDEHNYRELLARVAEAEAHPERIIDGERAMREIREFIRTKQRP